LKIVATFKDWELLAIMKKREIGLADKFKKTSDVMFMSFSFGVVGLKWRDSLNNLEFFL